MEVDLHRLQRAPAARPDRRGDVSLTEHVAHQEGRRLRYIMGGSGEPLVLLHGFLGSAENFETWFDELSARRTLIVPDLPGFGDSDPLRVAHPAEALAGAVEPLLRDLGGERFDLGGLCRGGSPALVMAQRHAGRVGRLVLHTPLLDPSLVRRRFHLQAGAMTAPGVFNGFLWLSHRRVVSDVYKRLMVEGDGADRAAPDITFPNRPRSNP